MIEIKLIQGDITTVEADAIVNAANSGLYGGGGVDGAIHRAGGPAILEDCRRIRREVWPDGLPVGEAVATTAGKLPAKWVIHTVGPRHSAEDRARKLASCHTRALAVAADLGAETVTFPAISTGIYGYPVDEAAVVAIEAVNASEAPVRLVTFVLFDEETFAAFRSAHIR